MSLALLNLHYHSRRLSAMVSRLETWIRHTFYKLDEIYFISLGSYLQDGIYLYIENLLISLSKYFYTMPIISKYCALRCLYTPNRLF